MKKIISILMAAILLTLLLAGCSGTKTVTVTQPAVTVTITKTSSPATVTITETSIPVTVTATTTVTPTWIPSIYRGSLNCTYTGTMDDGSPLSGPFTVIIDENGNIQGTFAGIYSGTITGQVNPVGNIIAIGKQTGSTVIISSTWSANLTLSGKALSVRGDWTSDVASGNFTGTGKVSY